MTTPAPILVVDLDDTLIQTDMLLETFWASLSAKWGNFFKVPQALLAGRANLKARLRKLGPVDVASLPYNEAVLERIRAWKETGGLVALVSASDQEIVADVAAHVGLFDESHGSKDGVNLKGPRKLEFLQERFPDGFAYMGDSEADLAVWRHATLALSVGASAALRAKIAHLGVPTEHVTDPGSKIKPVLKALRPHQWLKNALIFLPMLLAHQLELHTFGAAVLAFAAFSVVASSVYVLNDLLDLASDRAHPRKRRRPFASGGLPLIWGTLMAPGLLLLGVVLSALVGWSFLGVMVVYYVVTTLYSFSLKRKLVVDICALAGLYTIRIVAGGVATGTVLSVWLLAFSIFFFFSLAAIKRQAELVSGLASGNEKAHGRGYLTTDLPFVSQMAVSAGYVSVLVMALYVNSEAVQTLYSSPLPLWGICLVLLYWLSRMVMITHRGWMHDDPVVFAATDRISLFCAVLIGGLAVAAAWL